MKRISMCGTSALLVAVLGFATPALAKNSNPGIAPPNSSSHGRTMGEWAQAWWQWALGIPAATNPVLDGTGEFCDEGQSGSVWFLAANTFGGSAERTCTVPKGKAIFLPVYNWIFGASVYDCEPSGEGPCDVPLMRELASDNTEAAEILDVTIDGESVADVALYRAMSSGTFAVELPEGNFLGLPAGSYAPNIVDGYWLMLNPLTPGEHTIEIYVLTSPETTFGTIEFSVVSHVTVE